MPWACCDDSQIQDDLFNCPSCGKAKTKWTMRFNKTRVFSVGGFWVKIELLDWNGVPVAGEPYVLKTPKGKLREGNLDEDGVAHEKKLPRGDCVVWFPEREWVYDPEDGIPARISDAWIEVELLDADGTGVPQEPYRITDADGTKHEGELDHKGRVKIEKIPHGPCRIEFPDRDQSWWEETEFPGIDPRALLEWVKIELLDHADNPVGLEPYRITLPDETVREGRLGSDGRAFEDKVPAGTCTVEFPDRDETWFMDFDKPASKQLGPATAWIEIELLDHDGSPIPDEPYRITLPDETTREGTLDGLGRAKEEDVPPGTCKVEFTDRDISHFDGAEAPGKWEGPPVRDEDWIEIELLDHADAPVANEPYVLVLGDGTRHEGTLDHAGRVRLDGFAPGECTLEFPERDETWFTGVDDPEGMEARDKGPDTAWIEIELLDHEDNPLPNDDYVIVAKGGERFEGKLDHKGRAREEVPVGACQVSFPGRDARDFS